MILERNPSTPTTQDLTQSLPTPLPSHLSAEAQHPLATQERDLHTRREQVCVQLLVHLHEQSHPQGGHITIPHGIYSGSQRTSKSEFGCQGVREGSVMAHVRCPKCAEKYSLKRPGPALAKSIDLKPPSKGGVHGMSSCRNGRNKRFYKSTHQYTRTRQLIQ